MDSFKFAIEPIRNGADLSSVIALAYENFGAINGAHTLDEFEETRSAICRCDGLLIAYNTRANQSIAGFLLHQELSRSDYRFYSTAVRSIDEQLRSARKVRMVAVETALRGNGIGKALMETLPTWADAYVGTCIGEPTGISARMVKSCGFRIAERYPKYFRTGQTGTVVYRRKK